MRASKVAGGALTGVVALAIVAFWAGAAVFFWAALKPYRVAVAEVWELIPAGARGEVAVGLGIAGGVLLALFVIAGIFGKDQPARRDRASRGTYAGVDAEVDFDD
jgi:hypothetical protein